MIFSAAANPRPIPAAPHRSRDVPQIPMASPSMTIPLIWPSPIDMTNGKPQNRAAIARRNGASRRACGSRARSDAKRDDHLDDPRDAKGLRCRLMVERYEREVSKSDERGADVGVERVLVQGQEVTSDQRQPGPLRLRRYVQRLTGDQTMGRDPVQIEIEGPASTPESPVVTKPEREYRHSRQPDRGRQHKGTTRQATRDKWPASRAGQMAHVNRSACTQRRLTEHCV